MRSRPVLVVAVLLALCAMYLGWGGPVTGVDTPVVSEVAPAAARSGAVLSGGPTEASAKQPILRETPGTSSRLVVRTTYGESDAIATVAYIAYAGAAAPLSDLDVLQAKLAGRTLPELGVVTTSTTGRCVVDWSRPHGVCMVLTASSPQVGRKILHLSPWVGEKEVHVNFGLPECTLWVQVFDASLQGPAERAHIEVVDAEGELTWHGFSGVDGIASVLLPVGAYQVRIAGAAIENRDAWASCRFLPQAGPQSQVVRLAVPEVSKTVSWEVIANFKPVPGVVAALVVQRLDAGREWVGCVFQQLQPGRNQCESELPVGTYRAMVLPQGCLRPVYGGSVVEVKAEMPSNHVRMQLSEGEISTIRLSGLPSNALPVRLRFVSGEDMDETLASRAFAGRPTWHDDTGPVGMWEAGQDLLVHHRSRCWVGCLPAFQAGGTVEVPVVYATLLNVAHPVAPELASGALYLVLRSSSGEVIRSMRRKMQDLGFGKEPVWAASHVLRHGPWAVSLMDANGLVLATRDLQAEGGVQDLRL